MIRSMRCNNNVCTMKYELYVEYVSFLRKLCSWLHVRMICNSRNLLRRTEKSPLPPSRYIYIFHPSTSYYRTKNFTSISHFLFKKLHQFPNSSSHHDLQPSSHFYSLIHHPSTSVISYLPSPKTCSFFFPSSPALDAPPHPIPPINQLSSTNFTLAKTFPTPEVILSSLPSPIFSSHSPSPPPITFHKSSGAT